MSIGRCTVEEQVECITQDQGLGTINMANIAFVFHQDSVGSSSICLSSTSIRTSSHAASALKDIVLLSGYLPPKIP